MYIFGVVFSKGVEGLVFYFHILGFQYFVKRESTFNILNIFYFCYFTIFFQVHNLLGSWKIPLGKFPPIKLPPGKSTPWKIPTQKIPIWNIPTHFSNCLSSLFLHLILRP